MINQSTFCLALLMLFSCGQNPDTVEQLPLENPTIPLTKGNWRLVFDLGEEELPVNLRIRQEDGLKVDFLNSDEVITAYQYAQSGDSLTVRMPLFDSEFCGVIGNEGKSYSGIWRNYGKSKDYSIPFTATHGTSYRFCETQGSAPSVGLPAKWEVHFSPDNEEDHYPAVGMFEASKTDNRITGTFMTETGDYRFLEGNLCGDQFKLSCFDGSHAFLFLADWDGSNLLNGRFMSGIHWQEPWSAHTNEVFELRDPDLLTTIVDSSLVWKTSLYSKEGQKQHLADLGLEGKVLIVQALGSWCPNCIDESRDYKYFYERYHEIGLEIVPIAFENTEDYTVANAIISEFRSDLQLPYPVYYGGKKSKATAQEVFPSLDHVMSFPTSLIIGRDGTVRTVHTGFYGPGTKRYYELWRHDTELLLKELLSEK